MTNYLIYQAYGSPDILNEALFSILSYLRIEPDAAAQIIVYTDNAPHFQNILGELPQIHYQLTPASQWQEWRGAIDFVHRVKVKVLQHAAANYNGNLLYLDTDTVFRSSPAPIFAGIGPSQRYMHLHEGSLRDGNSLNKKINAALQQPAAKQALQNHPIPPETAMYNAGALGFHTSDAPLLEQVLQLTETLYRLYPKHVMEQLAFSIAWAQAGKITEAAPQVYHYWNLKEIRPVLNELFEAGTRRTLAEWQARISQLNIEDLAEGKAAFRRNPGWRRAVLRWLGRDWKLPSLQFQKE